MGHVRRLALAATVAAALTAGAGAPGAQAAASATCSLTPTSGTVTRAVGARTYSVSVPAGLTGATPLLLSLHGAGSTSAQDEFFTGWTPFAAAHGFIVAYPQARGSSYSGLWDPYTSASPDVADLKAMVADIAARWCVDPQRVFADGWSNGAVMSQRVACGGADVFAAASSYAGGSPEAGGFGSACTPSRPIAVQLYAGQEDFTFATLAQNAAEWAGRDGCTGTPIRTSDAYGSTATYAACAGGAAVTARTVANTSHNWPSGAQGEDQRARMWAFFTAHPKP